MEKNTEKDKNEKKSLTPFLKANMTSIEFCMNNSICFHTEEVMREENEALIRIPICNISNSCQYHGQKLPDGRSICDFILMEQNKIKKANYLAGGQYVWK